MAERINPLSYLRDVLKLRRDSFYPGRREMLDRLSKNPHRDEIVQFVGGKAGVERLLRWPKQTGRELTDIGILRHFIAGNILIEPFNPERLQNNGYDVTLGEYYYECVDTKTKVNNGVRYPLTRAGDRSVGLFNPLDEQNVQDVYEGPKTALAVGTLIDDYMFAGSAIPREEWLDGLRLFNELEREDKVIIVKPGEMILCHTQEYIGGRNVIDTQISGKSTAGRLGIEVCSDANKGDVGFQGRWTLEIRNKHPKLALVLVVGGPYATVSFMEVETPVNQYQGKYWPPSSGKAEWSPEMMLPSWRGWKKKNA